MNKSSNEANIIIRIQKEKKRNLQRLLFEDETNISDFIRKAIDSYIEKNKDILKK